MFWGDTQYGGQKVLLVLRRREARRDCSLALWDSPSDSDLDLCGTPASVSTNLYFHSYFFLILELNQTLSGPNGPTGSDMSASNSVPVHRLANKNKQNK